MQANDFDALLRSRFAKYQPEYDAAAWKSLAEKLPPAQSSRRTYALWPVGLGLAASIAAACILIFRQPAPQYKAAGSLVQHPTHRQAPVITQLPVSGSKVARTFASTPGAVTGNPATSHRLHPIAQLDKPVVPMLTRPATMQQDLQMYADPAEKEPLPAVAARTERHTGLEYPVPVDRAGERAMGKETIISLAGGVQYGSLNTGYAAGIQVQHKLGSRWYAETEIGYQHYAASGTNQLSTVDYNLVSNGGQSLTGPDSTHPTLQPNQIIRYIQASPGIGYHLSKAISIGAGVDFQRALQSGDEKSIEVEGNDLKVLPLLDIGATGRVSFRLSEWLEAGILYRHGVNNLLQSRQSYLDRQYLQVQLKVPLVKR